MSYCPNCSQPKSAARWGTAKLFAHLTFLKCPCGYTWAAKKSTVARPAGRPAAAQGGMSRML